MESKNFQDKEEWMNRDNNNELSSSLANHNSSGSIQSKIDPNHLNLRQLRVELKRLGLSPSGLKAELRRRLKNAWGDDSESPHASDDESNSSNMSSKGDSSPERKLDDSDASSSASLIKRKNFPTKTINNQAKIARRYKRKHEHDDEDDQYSEDDLSDAEWDHTQHKNKKIAAKGTGINLFLGQAQLELYKINLQRQHDAKIKMMNDQIDSLNEQLQKKEETVQDLKRTLKERTAALTSLGFFPADLGQGFGCLQTVILEKLNKENNKVGRNLRPLSV